MTDNQQLNKREKPRYYATDFPEILEKIPLADRVLYQKYQEQFHGIGKFASKKAMHHHSTMHHHSAMHPHPAMHPPKR